MQKNDCLSKIKRQIPVICYDIAGIKLEEQEVDGISDFIEEVEMKAKLLRKKKRRKWGILVLLLLILVGAGIGLWYANLPKAAKGGGSGGSLMFFDDSAKTGSLPGKTREEIQADLNRVVDQGMFNISIAAEVYFEDGSKEGAVRIENVKANPYYMQVTIKLDDTGETLYESKAIKTNQYIESIKLARDLPKGSYPATAVFTALDQNTLEAVGTAAAKITLIVGH